MIYICFTSNHLLLSVSKIPQWYCLIINKLWWATFSCRFKLHISRSKWNVSLSSFLAIYTCRTCHSLLIVRQLNIVTQSSGPYFRIVIIRSSSIVGTFYWCNKTTGRSYTLADRRHKFESAVWTLIWENNIEDFV